MIKLAKDYLQKYFNFPDFREGQKLIIQSTLKKKDTLGVMPTGGGKSLCYQIPALCFDGITIVISPLISLMKDQMDFLKSVEYPAAMLNSTVSYSEQHEVKYLVENNLIKLLYLTPERFANKKFLEWIKRITISLFCIDEAHCISEWGHDFRPEYRKLAGIIKELKSPPVLALTATATQEVRDDIVKSLNMKKPNVFVSGFNRDNLIYGIQNHHSFNKKNEALIEFLNKVASPGIIYVSSKKAGENLINILSSALEKNIGIYHGGLKPRDRKNIQEKFLEDKVDILIATNAFGMGVNKSNIRFVVHYNIPGTIESYYQETGRAGRDGKLSYCLLLHLDEDEEIQYFFIEAKNPSLEDMKAVLSKIKSFSKKGEIFLEELCDLIESKEINNFKIEAIVKQLHHLGYIEFDYVRDKNVFIKINSKKIKEDALKTFFDDIIVFEKYNQINTSLYKLTVRTGLTEKEIMDNLKKLAEHKYINFQISQDGKLLRLIKDKISQEDQILYKDKVKKKIEYDKSKFKEVIKYAQLENQCRRKFLLNYFGEDYHEPNCEKCDVCRGTYISKKQNFKIEEIHKKIITFFLNHDNEIGKQKSIKILKGSFDLDPKYREWDEYSKLKNYDITKIENEVNYLIKYNILRIKSGKYPLVSLTDKGISELKKFNLSKKN